MVRNATHGSWPSPITPDLLVEKVVGLSDVRADGDAVYWNESRPAESGRQVVVRRDAGGSRTDMTPAGFSARTLVHEYGGSSYVVRDGVVWFSNFADQRVWRVSPGRAPVAVTAEGSRYADLDVSPDGGWIAAVRERHLGDGVHNDVVVFPASGGGEQVVAEGRDFYSAPRWSPDGRRLCWLCWDHPDMPWDASELWVSGPTGGGAQRRAGGPGESISQPRWAPNGDLVWVSDRTGWWNLYREGHALARRDAEFSGPDWVFGQATYAFLGDGRLVAAWSEQGSWQLGVAAIGGDLKPVDVPYRSFSSVRHLAGSRVVAVAGSPTEEPATVAIDVDTGEVEVLCRSREAPVDPAYLSVPEAIEFPTTGGRTAHALWYPPKNPDVDPPEGELPPLLVLSHGGPTSAASPTLNLQVQYFTSRGIGVVDVNYGGSTGYGRAYRQRLEGQWGVVDVDDCVAAARHLADGGLVDGTRMAIKGGSAGGYTTLCALTFRPGVFAAGLSRFGVADAEALARDTHKFEARYLDRLIGPWPEAAELYRERSPIHHTDRLSCPLLLLQGLEDKVVPPEQSEAMAAALRRKGIPFAYLAFEGEQHGFRRADTIRRAAAAELAFLGRVFGFVPDLDAADRELPLEGAA